MSSFLFFSSFLDLGSSQVGLLAETLQVNIFTCIVNQPRDLLTYMQPKLVSRLVASRPSIYLVLTNAQENKKKKAKMSLLHCDLLLPVISVPNWMVNFPDYPAFPTALLPLPSSPDEDTWLLVNLLALACDVCVCACVCACVCM
jgi:hypothetical protein